MADEKKWGEDKRYVEETLSSLDSKITKLDSHIITVIDRLNEYQLTIATRLTKLETEMRTKSSIWGGAIAIIVSIAFKLLETKMK